MPWNWGKISDLDLEIEVKRCYRSLLEAQETSENCLRTHDDVGKALEGRATPSKGSSDGWRFINPSKSAPLIFQSKCKKQSHTSCVFLKL